MFKVGKVDVGRISWLVAKPGFPYCIKRPSKPRAKCDTAAPQFWHPSSKWSPSPSKLAPITFHDHYRIAMHIDKLLERSRPPLNLYLSTPSLYSGTICAIIDSFDFPSAIPRRRGVENGRRLIITTVRSLGDAKINDGTGWGGGSNFICGVRKFLERMYPRKKS